MNSKIILLLFIATSLFAGTYWVDDNGAASWANAESATPLSGASATTYALANSNAAAGDTVYYRTGTYTISSGSGISPSNSGTSGNTIVFMAYNGEAVVFTGQGTAKAVSLESGQDYIELKDLKFDKFYHHLHMQGSSGNWVEYNEIDNCTFQRMVDSTNIDWRGSTLENYVRYTWIHDSEFSRYGYFGNNDDEGVVLELGWDSGLYYVEYNLVEDCTFYSSGHHTVGIQGKRNVFRNNYIQNEAWQDISGTDYGCKVLYSIDLIPNGQHLLEGNRISFGANSSEGVNEGEGFLLSSRGWIIRNNVFDHHNMMGIYFHRHGSGNERADESRIYNNTFWYNGYDVPLGGYNYYSHAIVIWTGAYDGSVTQYTDENIFINNIFYNNANLTDTDFSIYCDIGAQQYYPNHCEYWNNWEDATDGSPLFVNTSGTPDPDDADQFDLSLQSESPCIDAGGYLTEITSSTGSGTSFTVADTGFFFDGWGIDDVWGETVINGDTIQFEGTSTTRIITSISGTTINVNSSVSWTQGDSIALAWSGTDPDIGAYEYSGAASPAASQKKFGEPFIKKVTP